MKAKVYTTGSGLRFRLNTRNPSKRGYNYCELEWLNEPSMAPVDFSHGTEKVTEGDWVLHWYYTGRRSALHVPGGDPLRESLRNGNSAARPVTVYDNDLTMVV